MNFAHASHVDKSLINYKIQVASYRLLFYYKENPECHTAISGYLERVLLKNVCSIDLQAVAKIGISEFCPPPLYSMLEELVVLHATYEHNKDVLNFLDKHPHHKNYKFTTWKHC